MPPQIVGFAFFDLNFRLQTHSCSVSVANQEYRIAVNEESVVLYNDVIFKCNIQSHVTDFVTVTGWVDSEGQSHSSGSSYGNCHAMNFADLRIFGYCSYVSGMHWWRGHTQ